MISKIMNLFKQEPYPSTPEEWKNNENTVFREFYLKSSPDFDILCGLVRDHMSEQSECPEKKVSPHLENPLEMALFQAVSAPPFQDTLFPAAGGVIQRCLGGD